MRVNLRTTTGKKSVELETRHFWWIFLTISFLLAVVFAFSLTVSTAAKLGIILGSFFIYGLLMFIPEVE